MTGKVAIITGGSQDIGAGLVARYRGRGWAVVASAPTIKASDDPDLVTVAGDIADAATADRIAVRHLYRKLAAHSRREAVQRARAIGLRTGSSRRPKNVNGERAITYGHAERNLALLRQLEAEIRQLLESLDQPDREQSAWLQEVTRANSTAETAR
jgi:NAD(P)-dependent dehydrogenase (short-subunit alcohol dehydrogenase family)